MIISDLDFSFVYVVFSLVVFFFIVVPYLKKRAEPMNLLYTLKQVRLLLLMFYVKHCCRKDLSTREIPEADYYQSFPGYLGRRVGRGI